MYADQFLRQEIDGPALMLLTEDHLMTTLGVKLGPALKICSCIRDLRERSADWPQDVKKDRVEFVVVGIRM